MLLQSEEPVCSVNECISLSVGCESFRHEFIKKKHMLSITYNYYIYIFRDEKQLCDLLKSKYKYKVVKALEMQSQHHKHQNCSYVVTKYRYDLFAR